MHSPVIILTMISIAYAGTIAPSSLNGKMLKEQLVNEQSTVDGATSPVQNNNPPPSSHIYPTYPVYSSNTQAVARTEYENYLTAAPVQKTVQKTWSYENIISSLIPFTTSLVIYSARAGTFLLQFLMVILVGVASTSMICIHTSICDTFMGKIKVKELARMYITPENLDIATTMVSKALDKHSST
ncbi:unnamed protein product [Lasius platythorax]|uniref:Uncharacterized protein n=1 Tax=Lasius platythorax TaxID=488582 RepID=A0AAV2P8M0_9HYME